MAILIDIIVIIFSIGGLLLTLANLPGIWLVFSGLYIFALYDNFTSISGTNIAVLFVISIIASVIDNVVTPIGAKKYGSSNWGMFGAFLGCFIGVIVGGPIGLIAGPLLGATLFEVLFAKKEINTALKSGIGALIGLLVSVILKFGVTVSVVIWGLGRVF